MEPFKRGRRPLNFYSITLLHPISTITTYMYTFRREPNIYRHGSMYIYTRHMLSCPDSVHNDGERHIPYIMIFPETVINKMYAWASFQLENGMIKEQLRCGCMSLPIEPIVSLLHTCTCTIGVDNISVAMQQTTFVSCETFTCTCTRSKIF